MKTILVQTLLGVALLISPQLTSALSITPASRVTLATDPPVVSGIHPTNEGSEIPHIQQRPQISPPKFAINTDQEPEQRQQILPLLLTGPLQPSSDILPPDEVLDDNDGSFNVKTKRQNDIQSQNAQARFLIPGVNWGWTGIIGANHADMFTYIAGEPGSVEVKEGSCPAAPPISSYFLTCQLQECEEDANCFGARKCCRFHCAFICVNPVVEIGIGNAASKSSTFLPNLITTRIFEEGGNSNYEKPGSCYRPGNGFGSSGSGYYQGNYRSRRQVSDDSNQVFYSNDANNGPSPYYTNSNGGGFGGGNSGGSYPGGNYNPGGQHGGNGGGSSYCSRDRECPGNKKCCNRLCRTPAYFG